MSLFIDIISSVQPSDIGWGVVHKSGTGTSHAVWSIGRNERGSCMPDSDGKESSEIGRSEDNGYEGGSMVVSSPYSEGSFNDGGKARADMLIEAAVVEAADEGGIY